MRLEDGRLAIMSASAAMRRSTEVGAAGRRTVRALGWTTAAYFTLALLYAAENAISMHGATVLLVAVGALLALTSASRMSSKGGVALVLVATFSAQIVWATTVDAQPFGALGVLWEEARRFAAEFDVMRLVGGASPGAAAFYGLLISAVGDDVAILRVVSATLWTVQTWLVWRIAHMIAETRGAALGAATAFGLAPAVLAFGGLISAEAVFGPLALWAIYAVLSHRRRGLLESAAMSGALAGAAFLVSPAGACYLTAILVVLAAASWRAQGLKPRFRLVAALLICGASFAVVVAPWIVAAHQDGASLHPARSPGYQLLLGVNRESVDGYSLRDLEKAGFIGGEPDDAMSEAAPEDDASPNDLAATLAFRRIVDDPLGVLFFAFTDKLDRLWASSRELLAWSLESPALSRSPWLDEQAIQIARLSADGVLIALLFAVVVGAARLAHGAAAISDPSRWILILGVVLSLALAHLIFDARERHQLAFLPMLAVLSPIAVAPMALRKRWRYAASLLRERVAQALAPREDAAKPWAPMRMTPPKELALKQESVSDPAPETGDTPGTRTRTASVRS